VSRALRAIAVLPFLIAATLAVAQTETNGPATVITTPFGRILAGPDGHTLYSYDGDVGGVPACYGDCAVFWPPFLAQEGATPVGDWTIVPRTDGPSMWAYRGKPLYYWHADNIAGQTYGRGMDGVWHIVPAGDPADGGMDAYGMGM
jgi:predicted lipoprotein with Yx(FWY)xxD motif